MTIAQNIVAMNAITAATDDAAIVAAAKASSRAVDVAALPAELAGFESYLANAAAASSSYAKDSSSWHNQSFFDLVVAEASRESTWPFLVGIFSSWLLLGVFLPSAIPQEGRKDSKYIQRLEGRHVYPPKHGSKGHGHHDDHGHGHDAHHAHH
jgi:hypothetical protein